jgi:hypothetical protein
MLKSTTTQSIRLSLIAFLTMLPLAGCDSDTVQVGETSVGINTSFDEQPNAVCNPFGGTGAVIGDMVPTTSRNGLIGKIYSGDGADETWTHASDYQTRGTELDATLYLDQLNVPTREFSRGFVTNAGATLQTPNGDTLYEWFGLKVESEIRLTSDQAEGRYQFAVLSDDGAVFSIDDTGTGLRRLINNDGLIPTTMRCAQEGIELTRASSIPIRVDYFQGPRFHVSLMLMWRKLPDVNASLSDTACDKGGNYVFFNPDFVPSTPTTLYNDMLARGWKVVQPANYHLPESVGSNPCSGGGTGMGGGGLGGGPSNLPQN